MQQNLRKGLINGMECHTCQPKVKSLSRKVQINSCNCETYFLSIGDPRFDPLDSIRVPDECVRYVEGQDA